MPLLMHSSAHPPMPPPQCTLLLAPTGARCCVSRSPTSASPLRRAGRCTGCASKGSSPSARRLRRLHASRLLPPKQPAAAPSGRSRLWACLCTAAPCHLSWGCCCIRGCARWPRAVCAWMQAACSCCMCCCSNRRSAQWATGGCCMDCSPAARARCAPGGWGARGGAGVLPVHLTACTAASCTPFTYLPRRHNLTSYARTPTHPRSAAAAAEEGVSATYAEQRGAARFGWTSTASGSARGAEEQHARFAAAVVLQLAINEGSAYDLEQQWGQPGRLFDRGVFGGWWCACWRVGKRACEPQPAAKECLAGLAGGTNMSRLTATWQPCAAHARTMKQTQASRAGSCSSCRPR